MSTSKSHTGYLQMAKAGLLHLCVVAVIGLWIYGISEKKAELLNGLEINIHKIDGIRDLVNKKDVIEMLRTKSDYDLAHTAIKDLRISDVEEALQMDTRIHKPEVYIDAQNNLIIDIIQRRPIVRIMSKAGDQYYLDQAGHYISKTEFRAVRVPVATGLIESYATGDDIATKKRLQQVYALSVAIHKDKFLSALIEQIHVGEGNRIVLTPKIGSEKIVIIHHDNLEDKLQNLKSFYAYMAKKNKWGDYSEIDISYNKQVIGRA